MKKSKKLGKRVIAHILIVAMLAATLALLDGFESRAAGNKLISQGRSAYASSVNGWRYPSKAVDGDLTAGWESVWKQDPQWIYLDLGDEATITKVKMTWDGGAYAKDFKLQVSDDELNWSDIYTMTDNTLADNQNDISIDSARGRYIRLYCTRRSADSYGYNLREIQVYGSGGAGAEEVFETENMAAGRSAVASSVERGSHISAGSTDAANVTDGNKWTRWSSEYDSNNTANKKNEWIYVDLGSVKTIGSVVLYWESAYARAYDIQVSDDANNWTTVYRQLEGSGKTEKISLYTSGRYVRMYGHAKGSGYGYSMYEFEVHNYVDGMPQPNHEIKPVPEKSVVQVGSGSYVEDIALMQPKTPRYKTDNITTPIPSNKWWTSLMVERWGNALVTLPGKAEVEETGLAILYAGKGTAASDGGSVNAGGAYDFFVNANNINSSKMDALVNDYGDYSVEVYLTDDTMPKMKATLVKGSPYYYFEYSDRNSVELYSQVFTRFYDDNGNTLLTGDGDTVTADHIGFEVQNYNEKNEPVTRNYGVFAPEGTTFQKVGNKVKIKLGSNQNYMSVGVLKNAGDLNYMYQHAYAFVKDTYVDYRIEDSKVITTMRTDVELKRSGFSSDTLMCLLPHQWKKVASGTSLTNRTYESIRGDMKVYEGNSFATVDHFNGIIPQFAEPENSEYSREEMISYLRWLEEDLGTSENYSVADPYWQGKVMHPLASAILAADQLGEMQLRDHFIRVLREILANWLTYSGDGDVPYYMYFSPAWGTVNGDGGDHGMAVHLSDHHYLWAYFTYAAGVLGAYDESFVQEYGGMVDLLIRDVGTPDRNDSMFPYLRNFDPYEGHSWAGGYADNDNGANQEAAAECLFAWVGQYLWGMVTENDEYRDAAIYMYTTESYANMLYWFNYDGDSFHEDYQYGSVGMLFGGSINFGTYFSGDPENIYGIHWLPTSPHITIYGLYPEKANNLYNRFLEDLNKKSGRNVEQGWYHIIWPFQALGNPAGAAAKFDANAVLRDGSKKEVFNTYYFINNMLSAGSRNGDFYCSNWTSYNLFKKGDQYTAMIWNPTDEDFVAEFKSFATGQVVSTIDVPANSTVKGDPTGNASGTPEQPEPNPNETESGVNLAKGKDATAFSELGGNTASMATDGNAEGTRWESVHEDNQWIYVDLGNSYNVNRVKLIWEVAAGKNYTIDVSNDASSWTTVYTKENGNGGTEELAFDSVNARYVRMNGQTRTTGYGFSLWEFEVYGTGSSSGQTTPTEPTEPSEPGETQEVSNVAKGKTASTNSPGNGDASNGIDGDKNSRFESVRGDNYEMVYTIDLGSVYSVSRAKIDWEAETTAASKLRIEVSENANGPWTTVYSKTEGNSEKDFDKSFTAQNARYVKLTAYEKSGPWGYSFWEFEVYGR